jgi:hypothetical protein
MLGKIKKWLHKDSVKPNPPIDARLLREGVCMNEEHQQEVVLLQPELLNWLKLYLRVGAQKRSSKMFLLAKKKISHYFTLEQLRQQMEIALDVKLENKKRIWNDLMIQHLTVNNLPIPDFLYLNKKMELPKHPTNEVDARASENTAVTR